MSNAVYVIGVDFGTDSVRTLIVNAHNGEEVSSSVKHFKMWSEGRFCDPSKNQFRQHPKDYVESMEKSIVEALLKATKGIENNIKGISVDTTGSTPCAVDKEGTPLALLPEFETNPNGMFILWKDHTAVDEADEINHTARNWGGTDFTMYEGGIYSSEWFWAKMLHTMRKDSKVKNAAFSWVEHCDWVTALLTGETDPLTIKRSRCAAGHKAMWHEYFGGLPSEDFLGSVDPILREVRKKLYRDTFTSNVTAGVLSKEWSKRLGLPEGIPIGVGAFDAHMGAVGGGIKPYTLSKVIGTSTCDMLVAPTNEFGDKLVKGICGQVDGSIIPGMIGLEAGQSAFGDIYAWFRDILAWPITEIVSKTASTSEVDSFIDKIIPALSEKAEALPIDPGGVVALDWMNGRRTPDANQLLKGTIGGLSLGSNAPAIFRALVESTAFGSRKIVERFENEGVPIKEVIALGGVAKKSQFVMQTLSNVLNRKIKVAKSEQTCALGAAMFAATVGGVYKKVEDAIKNMESGFEKEYRPEPMNAEKYNDLYNKYSRLGNFIEKETLREKRGV